MNELMQHQKIGIQSLIDNKCFALFDEPGIGKSRQVIEAANILFSKRELDLVLIICPAQVKFQWMDQELGEIVRWGVAGSPLQWIIISYEWLRLGEHVQEVCALLEKRRYMLVFDESSFLRNRTTKQFKACLGPRYGRVKIKNRWKTLSNRAVRTVLLNGTPIANHVMDLWAQFYALDKNILDCSYWQFREKHAVMGGFMRKEIVGYRDLDGALVEKGKAPVKLMDSLKPWVLCRCKRDVLDLPPMVRNIRTVALDEVTWKYYKEMRQEFLIEIGKKEFTAANAAVKAMRLAQITSGFITTKDTDYSIVKQQETIALYFPEQPKLDWLLDWLKESGNEPVIVWCWWRAQLDRLENVLRGHSSSVAITNIEHPSYIYDVFTLHGGTSKKEREKSLFRFNPKFLVGEKWNKRAILLAQPAAGGMGLNLSAASTNIHLSGSHSFISREQADGRIERPGQVNSMMIIDVIATGPKGQKTIDEVILKGRERKEELSTWTKSRWKEELNG